MIENPEEIHKIAGQVIIALGLVLIAIAILVSVLVYNWLP
jgi:hypothetical protein